MRLALFFLLALLSLPAHADRVLEFSDAMLTLTDGACTLGIDGAKGGRVTFMDARSARAACWIERDGIVFVIDEAGVTNMFSASAFTPTVGI